MTISTLVALGTEPELKLHINVGFIGFPRVLNALTLVKEVMAERGLAPESPADRL